MDNTRILEALKEREYFSKDFDKIKYVYLYSFDNKFVLDIFFEDKGMNYEVYDFDFATSDINCFSEYIHAEYIKSFSGNNLYQLDRELLQQPEKLITKIQTIKLLV